MPKVEAKGNSVQAKEGEDLTRAAEILGVPFGCYSGICGICKISVIKGKENLSPKTAHEEILDEGERLACQCKVHGDIEITF